MEVEPRHLSMDLIQPAARQSVLKLLTLRNTSEGACPFASARQQSRQHQSFPVFGGGVHATGACKYHQII